MEDYHLRTAIRSLYKMVAKLNLFMSLCDSDLLRVERDIEKISGILSYINDCLQAIKKGSE